jgi:hypothetical protein
VRIACQRKGSHFALWAPADVPDSSLDLGAAFASDVARVAEAAQRAIRRLQVPAVGRREVEAEIARDPALRPNGASSVAALLADASKAMIDAGAGARRRRTTPVVLHAGRVEGEAHYGVSAGDDAGHGEVECEASARERARARRYVDLLRLLGRWRQRDGMTQVECAAESLSAAASVGRLRIVEQGIAELKAATAQLRGDLSEDVPRVNRQIDELETEVDAVQHACAFHRARLLREARRLRTWSPALEGADARGVLEASGVTTRTGAVGSDAGEASMTTDEILSMVRSRGYARAMRATNPTEMVALLSHRLLRLDNGEFDGWRRKASEFHFERTDAMIFAAIQWGGGMAVLFAQFARQELGQLRDTRYVSAGLSHPRFDARMASAAALAFLPGDSASDELLAQAALQDTDAGVRRAALWAYGAAARPGLHTLVQRVLDGERHRDVLALARSALAEPEPVWWTI